jgi:hypothetical protein
MNFNRFAMMDMMMCMCSMRMMRHTPKRGPSSFMS